MGHLDGRGSGLAGAVYLGLAELLIVQTDGSDTESARVRMIGGPCRRAQNVVLDVPVKELRGMLRRVRRPLPSLRLPRRRPSCD